MKSIIRRMLEFLGLTALATLVITTIVALWHSLDTPQQLESILPGEERMYRWKHGHIFYKVFGAIDAPPLVLLHTPGVGASGYEMRKLMGPLAQHYRVYALDLLGFGLSDHPYIDYSAKTYIRFRQDFLAEIVVRPATLLASGLSCNYAVAVATRSPELCTGLVLISPTALFGRGEEGKQGLLGELVGLPTVASLVYPLVSTRTALRYRMERQRLQFAESELDHLYAATHQLGGEYAAAALFAGKLVEDVSRQFELMQQPTLIIWGARALNNVRAIASRQHMFSRAQVVLIEDTGKQVHEERPEAVITSVEEWRESAKKASPGVDASKVVSTRAPVVEASEAIGVSTPAVEEDEGRPGSAAEIEAYCVKCKKKVPMQDIYQVTMKNGRPAQRGTCPVCG